MADQRIAGPYGDIVQVVTPTLDNWAKQLYVQQKTRETRQQQENQALDQSLQKEFSNIRSVDTPDVVSSYNRYKQLKKHMLFNKDLQRDPLKYNQAQQAANEAWTDMQSRINQSKEIKEMTNTMTQDRFKNPDAYADDYGQRASLLMSTPLSVLKSNPQYGDLTNWDNYRYQGSNTNFNDIVSKVYDKKNKIIGKEEALDKLGIQFRSPVYEYGTAPAQVYEGLVNSLDHKTERDAAYKFKQLTPDVVQKIEQDYAAIPAQKWEQMGLAGPQQIDLRGGSDAEKYMRILAMQNAVNTSPRLVNYENRTSDKAKMDLQFARQKEMQSLKQKDAKALALYKKNIDPNDSEMTNAWVDNYLGRVVDDAKKKAPMPFRYEDGRRVNEYDIPLDPTLSKAMSFGKFEPDALRVDDDGNFRRVVYLRYGKGESKDHAEGDIKKDKTGWSLLDKTYSEPLLSKEQVEVALGKKALTPKNFNKYGASKFPNKSNKPIDDLRKKYDY